MNEVAFTAPVLIRIRRYCLKMQPQPKSGASGAVLSIADGRREFHYGPRQRRLWLAVCCAAMIGNVGLTEEPRMKTDQEIVQQAAALFETADSFAAFQALESEAAPLMAAARYAALMNEFYSPRRNVPAMVMSGRGGIGFCLGAAAAAARRAQTLPADAAADRQTAVLEAEKLRGLAKAMAYNLGANTWPGWAEPGLTITPSDQTAGADAARLNLRLAIELNRGPEPMGNARWLVGAHDLAAGRHKQADAHFAAAAAEFAKTSKPEFVLMALGYQALNKSLENPKDETAAANLATAIQKLMQHSAEDAKFFAEQVQTAAKALAKPKQ